MTIGDLIKWARIDPYAKQCFDGWSDFELTLAIEDRIKKNQIIVYTNGEEVKGFVTFEVRYDKKEVWIENIVSKEKGAFGKMIEKLFQNYGYGIMNSGEWTIFGERIGPYKHRKHGRKFTITPKFLKRLYIYG